MSKKIITVDHFSGYKEKIKDKNWYSEERYFNLLDRIEKLTDIQKDLIIELTEKFIYEEPNVLTNHLQIAYNNIPNNVLDIFHRICFVPLKKYGEKKDKSGDKALMWINVNFPDKFIHSSKIIIFENINDFIDNYNECDLIIFFDDFVATGNTVESVLFSIDLELEKKNKSLNYKNLFIVCIYVLQKGLNLLNAYHINCYYYKLINKAISENSTYSPEQKESKINEMKKIEKQVLDRLNSEFSLGFMESEALLSINDKSPNNTFPFYWHRAKEKKEPIFKRY